MHENAESINRQTATQEQISRAQGIIDSFLDVMAVQNQKIAARGEPLPDSNASRHLRRIARTVNEDGTLGATAKYFMCTYPNWRGVEINVMTVDGITTLAIDAEGTTGSWGYDAKGNLWGDMSASDPLTDEQIDFASEVYGVFHNPNRNPIQEWDGYYF